MVHFKRLFRERTRATIKGIVSFNNPGVYKPPYGSRVFELQGRGAPGNAPTPGNYAGMNPGNGGYRGPDNPRTPGNLAGYNPPTFNATLSIKRITTNYTNGVYEAPAYPGYSCPASNYGSGAESHYVCTPIPSYTVPGNAHYNPSIPGNATYNPYYPGNPYYNPVTPGNPGTPVNVLGVLLPGGNAGAVAPVIGYVPVDLKYSVEGVQLAVPSGGYVQIKNS